MSVVHNLTRLLAGLWNKIKPDSSAPTLSISDDDIVVFVVGPTGSGKSWFIREATRSELVKTSRDYHPFTTKVQAIRCELTDEAKTDLKHEELESIVFVDTPSFLTGCDDFDAQKEIRTWIERTEYKPRYLGMIYMHRIETDPAYEPIRKHLQEFPVLPGISEGHVPLRLHIVISYDKTSGNISDSKIMDRESTLYIQKDLLKSSTGKWQPSIHQEVFQGEPEVAWRAVEELFRTDKWPQSPAACDTWSSKS
ncbi:hypothetical protein HD554DRAFT_2167504 [Boletus coccyginus]|nr:hypothetical protein HD554DRAFT_2167504 [Boletus coccyginus]